ncbi:hypothetical protein RSSM_05556 [Rhodopirellula sallentina SM41]|uniref:Uncharacterized protein n=1 Tax=Rhodopirellula sallentina SM41 TaxID=1263870 RepID=M5TUY2_9BACT|nr:hypothetical protein RSSM_05556 [Rhodopirellula sallentina SM41]
MLSPFRPDSSTHVIFQEKNSPKQAGGVLTRAIRGSPQIGGHRYECGNAEPEKWASCLLAVI